MGGPPVVIPTAGGPKKFRTRPIDPYKLIPLVRELPADDKPADSGADAQQASGKDKKNDKPKVYNIPAPVSKQKSNFDKEVAPDFNLPSAYIRFRIERPDEYKLNDNVEYELTVGDMEWLEQKCKYGPALNSDPALLLSEDKLERMIDLLEKATARDVPITHAQALQLFAERMQLFQTPKYNLGDEVYQYWMSKRMRMKKPLLRRFWPVTASDDTSPHLTFRPREKERYKLRKKRENNIESFDKIMQLKKDFERVKLLLELVKRREKLHRLQAVLIQDEFEESIFQIVKKRSEARNPLVPDLESMPGPLEIPDDEIEVPTVPSTMIEEPVDPAASSKLHVKFGDKESKKKKATKKKQRDEEKKKQTELEKEAALLAQKKDKEERARKEKKRLEKEKERLRELREKEKEELLKALLLPPPSFLLPLDSFPHVLTPQEKVSVVKTLPSTRGDVPLFQVVNTSENQHAKRPLKPSGAVEGEQTRKFRCRGRIGRGGRYIIDRIPVQRYAATGTRENPQSEVGLLRPPDIALEPYATAKLQDARSSCKFIDPAKPLDRSYGNFAGDTKAGGPTPGPDGFKRVPKKFTATARNKIFHIYADSDSEDEEVITMDNPTAPVHLDLNYKPKFQFLC